MKLYVLDGGRAHLPDLSHLTPDRNVGVPVTIPMLAFLIDHPKGLVVFDTGVDTDGPQDDFLEVAPEGRVDRQIRRLGYEPADVRYVVVSHLHLDHMGCMYLFPGATFVVRRQELRAAWWPDAYEGGYDFKGLLRTRDLTYIQLADGEAFDLFGDRSLVCIDTKGHTEGHQSLVVDLPRTGKVVLVGDAVQVAENLAGDVTPGVCWSSQLALDAMRRLRHMQSQGALLILGHELSQLDTLRIAPEYYE
jgi:glyoxylase-like metal-dependent hydrolase (beta-lactamase superfamily II)